MYVRSPCPACLFQYHLARVYKIAGMNGWMSELNPFCKLVLTWPGCQRVFVFAAIVSGEAAIENRVTRAFHQYPNFGILGSFRGI